MSESKITFDGDIRLFLKFINHGTWNTVLTRQVRKATIKSCLYLIKAIKQEIRNKKYAGNAELTLALKKGNISLIDQRNLFSAITYELQSGFNAEIGVFNGQSTGGSSAPIPMQKLSELMHTGYTIKVTPKMRAAIMAALLGQRTKKQRLTKKAKAALSNMANAKGNGVQTFRVPPRPFLSQVWKKPEIQKMIRDNWRQALEQAFLEAGAKDGDHKEK